MATKNVKLKGIAMWAKVFEDNRDMKGYEDAAVACNGIYTINLDMEEEEFLKLKSTKAKVADFVKLTDAGLYSVRFKREHEGRFEWSSGQPKVKKSSGETWDYDIDGEIGNGSEVEVVVSVYDTKRPSIKGCRLEGVKVLNHVVFERREPDPFDFGEDEAAA